MHANAAPQKRPDTKVPNDRQHTAKVQNSTGALAANSSTKSRRVEPAARSEPAIAEREFGEGNYKAAKSYDQAAAQFVKFGEAAALERAEAEGRSHRKGDDASPASAGNTPKIP